MIISFSSTELTDAVIFEIKRPFWVLSILKPVFPKKKAALIKHTDDRIGIEKKILKKILRIILEDKFSSYSLMATIIPMPSDKSYLFTI